MNTGSEKKKIMVGHIGHMQPSASEIIEILDYKEKYLSLEKRIRERIKFYEDESARIYADSKQDSPVYKFVITELQNLLK